MTDDLDGLKRSVDMVALLTQYGVTLAKKATNTTDSASGTMKRSHPCRCMSIRKTDTSAPIARVAGAAAQSLT